MDQAKARVDEIFQVMNKRGGEAYFGEPVSQLQHALQAACLASQARSAPSLIAAALLHDIGHMLHALPENIADKGIDTHHEEIGYRWLLGTFGPAVAEPVRAHVAAKRYLCRVDPEYYSGLSPASVKSLTLQGGPLSPDEVNEFETRPWYREAVQLRRWDDAAKCPDLVVPVLDTYRALLIELLASVDR